MRMAALCAGASSTLLSWKARRALATMAAGALSPPFHPSTPFLPSHMRTHLPHLAWRPSVPDAAPPRRSLSTQAARPGSVDPSLVSSMESKIKDQLEAAQVVVTDTSGDGRHVSIDVISSAFEGQSQINRQRMVYKAIWEELQSVVHAVDQMRTQTPAEAEQERISK